MKLICFGDSWTAGHGVETDRQYQERVNIIVEKCGQVNESILKVDFILIY